MTKEHDDSIIALTSWLQTPSGRYVTDWERAQFEAVVADIFGFNAAQCGLLELDALSSSRMPFAFGVEEAHTGAHDRAASYALSAPGRRALVITDFEELPFASQSIDLIVLPHVLEFADDPHQVLREVERVLIAEGQLIVTGFNPTSLWGARQLIGRALDLPFLPRAGQFMRLHRLKDWLKLLGFEITRGRFGCYRPPFRSEKWLARFGFLEKAGDRWWPVCGSVYMVRAIKRAPGMRLIGALRKERVPASAALAPTTNRADAPVGCERLTQAESMDVS